MTRTRRKVAAFVLGMVADALAVALLLQGGYPRSAIFSRIAAALFLVMLHAPPVLAALRATARIRSRYERVGLRSIVLLVSLGWSLFFFVTGTGQQIARAVLGREIGSWYFGELEFLNQSAAILAGECVLAATWSFLWPREAE